jgi:hypothetical protein
MYNDKKNGDFSVTNKIKPDQNWWQKRNIGTKGLIIGLIFGPYGALFGLIIGAILGVIRFFFKSISSPFMNNKSQDTYSIPLTTPTDVESKIFCQNCNIQMDLDAIFCTSCGIKISIPLTTPTNVESKRFCQNCNIQIDLDTIFCTSCGIKIS